MEPAIVLLGPPGSGKGTQAERLERELGYATLATGDLLRQARAEDSELGRRAAEHMDRGELVPDDVIVEMVRKALAGHDGEPVALDGFPRTVAQAEALDAVLADRGRELTAAVLIDVPDEEVADRISGRDDDRDDDNPDTVRERLRVYHRDTEPLADHYERQGRLIRVDGTKSRDDVWADVRAAL